VAAVPATAAIVPASRTVRAASRRIDGGEILVMFNEGAEPYEGELLVDAPHVYSFHPRFGVVQNMRVQRHRIELQLGPGDTRVFLLSKEPRDAEPPREKSKDSIVLDDGIQAKPYRRYVVGEHDFEIVPQTQPPVPFAQAASWRTWLTEDYSGQVDYTASFDLPKDWENQLLQLETGPIEYAAQVLFDGKPVGSLLWAPWSVELPPSAAGHHEVTIRVANTLANELTSERITQAWAAKSGPGWPSPYHKRAIEFEKESRGGGLKGPVRLFALKRVEG
ncbi:MAG: hypothetical protein NTU83_08825, partial [Candidatus Hydrogenedentes bacterium]|nr:hypothetical protein [Candidatus Hydrogenedentota bacterium]